ncbi:MAG: multicopper oxidase domain-containing protein [Acidimicrobiales bacterium]
MSPANQTLLARFAVAISVFALVMVGVVAARGDSGGGGSDAASAAAAPVAVALSEFSIAPSTITVPLGGKIQVTNNGTVDHNVAVTDTAIKSADISAGGAETVDLSSLEPGDYELFCAIPGHKDSGMVATLTITDGSAASNASGSSADGADHGVPGADISTLEATSALAKQIDEQMQTGMDAGVAAFKEFNFEKYPAGEVKTGNQKIEPEILPDGTKKFSLTASVVDWEVSPGKVVKAWAYNGMVPGPWIRVEPNDKVRVELTNKLPISTDIHWHGVDVPNDQDGVAGITQDYILPNTTYTYEFQVGPKPQLAMYHAHYHGQEAVLNGLFAVVQVGDVDLPAPGQYGYFDIPEGLTVSQEIPMVLNDAGTIGLSLNGKAFPETQAIVADPGEYVLIHYYNEGLVGHPMHLHRQPQLVIAKDGFPLEAPYQIDTLWISPGERYSVLVKAEEPGVWAFHCHILNHAESNDGLIGMVTAMVVNDPNATS